MTAPEVSVLMPMFDQASFLPRALASVAAQTGPTIELVIVDDGSTDKPLSGLACLADQPQVSVRTVRHDENQGLGAALNTALDLASADVIAYLPADDVFLDGHLADLMRVLRDRADVVLVSDELDTPDPTGLQLVQVAHRRTELRWRTRIDVESDDLEALFFGRLRQQGAVVATGRVGALRTSHPGQRSRTFAPDTGGLNVFRRRYGARGPLLFAPRHADPTDERALYPDPPAAVPAADARHVLLVGELAYNPDRLLVLADRGFRFSGLWIDDPLGFMTVGPLPFPGVTDLPRHGWLAALRADPPDVAYCLLNWRTIPLALAVADALPELPLVWHFKEAPHRSLARGDWPLLAQLWRRADHVVLASAEERDWLEAALPAQRDPGSTSVLDGDLPRARWFAGPATPRPWPDDEVHTVCLGRPIGLSADFISTLAAHGIHVHFHGLSRADRDLNAWWADAQGAASGFVHRHPTIWPPCWRAELSGYDAGWLHVVRPDNGGDLRRARWDDLNLPARMPTMAAAGLPLLVPDPGHAVSAVARTARQAGADLPFTDADSAAVLLGDPEAVGRARAGMAAARHAFTVESVVDDLAEILNSTADRRRLS